MNKTLFITILIYFSYTSYAANNNVDGNYVLSFSPLSPILITPPITYHSSSSRECTEYCYDESHIFTKITTFLQQANRVIHQNEIQSYISQYAPNIAPLAAYLHAIEGTLGEKLRKLLNINTHNPQTTSYFCLNYQTDMRESPSQIYVRHKIEKLNIDKTYLTINPQEIVHLNERNTKYNNPKKESWLMEIELFRENLNLYINNKTPSKLQQCANNAIIASFLFYVAHSLQKDNTDDEYIADNMYQLLPKQSPIISPEIYYKILRSNFLMLPKNKQESFANKTQHLIPEYFNIRKNAKYNFEAKEKNINNNQSDYSLIYI